MKNPGQAGLTPAVDVHHRTDSSPRSGDTAEQRRYRVADSLPDEFPVGIVAGFGNVVGDDRGEQGVDSSEHGQGQGRSQIGSDRSQTKSFKNSQLQGWKAKRNLSDVTNGPDIELHRESGNTNCEQGDQRTRDFGSNLFKAVNDEDGCQCETQFEPVDVVESTSQIA